jgi:hypothetical protein
LLFGLLLPLLLRLHFFLFLPFHLEKNKIKLEMNEPALLHQRVLSQFAGDPASLLWPLPVVPVAYRVLAYRASISNNKATAHLLFPLKLSESFSMLLCDRIVPPFWRG